MEHKPGNNLNKGYLPEDINSRAEAEAWAESQRGKASPGFTQGMVVLDLLDGMPKTADGYERFKGMVERNLVPEGLTDDEKETILARAEQILAA